MFANPEVSAFIDRLIGGQTPHGGAPPPAPGYRGALARGLLGDLARIPPVSFTAPSISVSRMPEMRSLPSEGVGREVGTQNVPQTPTSPSSGGNTGASGLTSGLNALGGGIESALDTIAAKKKARDAFAGEMASHGVNMPSSIGGDASVAGAPDSTGAGLPSFARQAGVSAGTPSMAASGEGVGLKNQIAQHIIDYAIQRGVDPYRALGIAAREGLDRANPLATNPDGSIGGILNTAIGFYQFGTAGLGRQLGIGPTTPWQTQAEKAIDYMATHSPAQVTGQWHSIPDNGGWNAIRDIGKNYADRLGISPGGGSPAAAPPAAHVAAPSPLPAAPPTTVGTQPTGISSPPTQTGTYNGQPYTFQTAPALGQRGMLMPPQAAPQVDPLALALAGGQMPPIDPNFGNPDVLFG